MGKDLKNVCPACRAPYGEQPYSFQEYDDETSEEEEEDEEESSEFKYCLINEFRRSLLCCIF